MIGDEKDASSWISRVCATSIVPVFFTWVSLFSISYRRTENGKGEGFIRAK